jgi:hypothetical protein
MSASLVHRRFKNNHKHDASNIDNKSSSTIVIPSKALHSALYKIVQLSYHKSLALIMLSAILSLHCLRSRTNRSLYATTTNNIRKVDVYTDRTIAFVVTITSCDGLKKDNAFQIIDGGAVLQYSIHNNSLHGANGGTYDYKLYAFYHPDAIECATQLTELGYIVQPRPTPVNVSDIQNQEYRENIGENGCCGEKELIKLEAFTLVQHPLVVLLDMDVLILKPLDRLFDFMLDSRKLPNEDDLLYFNKPALNGRNMNVTIPDHVDLLYTTDYAMVNPDHNIKPVQGGFVILRPNQTIYDDFVKIVTVGDFRFDDNSELGWGGHTGRFWGGTYFIYILSSYNW